MDLSFQTTKNILSSIKIQGENGKNYSLPPGQFFLMLVFLDNQILYPKNLKIFQLTSKHREEI